MHRQLPAERRERVGVGLEFERHQHADLAEAGGQRVVHVGGDDAVARPRAAPPAQHQVLADRGDQSVSSSATVRPVPG